MLVETPFAKILWDAAEQLVIEEQEDFNSYPSKARDHRRFELY
jgi:hypothetical protein